MISHNHLRYVKFFNIKGREDYLLSVQISKDGSLNIDFSQLPLQIVNIIIDGGEELQSRLFGLNFLPVNGTVLAIDCSESRELAYLESSSEEEEDIEEVEQCLISLKLK